MENLSGHTPTQLLKISNDICTRHEVLKQEIITDTYELEKLEDGLNRKIMELQELEKNYVEIIEKLSE
jgi:hypothetical protein